MLLNLIEERCYVGQTEFSLGERVARHWGASRSGGTTVVCDALRRWDDPIFWDAVVLQHCTSADQLDMAEAWWMDECSSRSPGVGYNSMPGHPEKLRSERQPLTEAQREVFREAGRRGGIAQANKTKKPKKVSKLAGMTPEEKTEFFKAAGRRGASQSKENAAKRRV